MASPRAQTPAEAARAADGAALPPRSRRRGSDRRKGACPRYRTATAASDGTGRMPAAFWTRQRPAVDDAATRAVAFSGTFSRLARPGRGPRGCDRGGGRRAPRDAVGPVRRGAGRRAGRATTHSCFRDFRPPRVLSLAQQLGCHLQRACITAGRDCWDK